jgi:hypothetical protein
MPPAIPGNCVCLAFLGGRCAKKLNAADSCKNNFLKVLRIGLLLEYATVCSLKYHIYFLFLRFYLFFALTRVPARQLPVLTKKVMEEKRKRNDEYRTRNVE